MAKIPEPRISFDDLYRTILRHKRKVCGFCLSVIVLVTAVTLLSGKVYRSEGKLLVRLGRENVTLDATSTLGNAPVVAVPTDRAHEINSIVQILRSRVLAERVVDALGPQAILNPGKKTTSQVASKKSDSLLSVFESLTPRDRAILEFEKQLEVAAVKESNILGVTYDATDRELSRLVVEKLMEFFLEQHIRLHRTPGSHHFLEEQMKRSQSLLSVSETELRDLKNETGLASPADQRKLLVDRIARLEDELLQAEATRVATQTEWQMSQTVLSGGPLSRVTAENSGVADDSMDSMQRQLYVLHLKEQELLAKFTEDQPEVKQVRRQIAASQVVLEREEKSRRLTKWPRNTYEQTQLVLLQQETQLASLKSKSDAIGKQLQAARGELATLNGNEVQIQRLQRQVDIQDNTYRKYADNLEQANIDQALATERISNISIVQPAKSFIKPIRPRKLLNLILAVAFGLFGSLALALLCEQFDRSVKTRKDIEDQLDLSSLVSIPQTAESQPQQTEPRQDGQLNGNAEN
ncbi:MAG: GumC family protein [Planctomycetaceae bacterium]|jgi:polysaccharide biosynthesis protein PslE|nr:GumC family protein [Planctomycetaceae bacterium]MBT6153908.1 GumC family protein [Planctomycetaceae bacterium]MBT6486621.1 GumC family protein [Planctomycetaceae bacterium]MBT6496829.1 GumC family protein [Planctomycetaceae bacterium]